MRKRALYLTSILRELITSKVNMARRNQVNYSAVHMPVFYSVRKFCSLVFFYWAGIMKKKTENMLLLLKIWEHFSLGLPAAIMRSVSWW